MSINTLVIFSFCWVFINSHGFSELKTLSISGGTITGKRVSSYGGHAGIAFLGIPFARAPVGNLRFKKPVAVKSWNETLDCTRYKAACVSDSSSTYKYNGGYGPVSEDCLYLNVFTSDECIDQGGCAVLAVLHGGAYMSGSPVLLDPEIIVNNFANEDRKVIVVTLPYRLGLFGFFHLPNEASADSNLALRDTIHGLEWIRREIQAFGGEKTKVTALGHSAGPIFVNLLSLSPAGDSHFSQMILMSGTGSVGELSTAANHEATKKIIELVGCSEANTHNNSDLANSEVMKCMRQKSWSEILDAQKKLRNIPQDIYGPWQDAPNGVLPSSVKVLEASRRPVHAMIGTVTGEMRTSRFAADSNGYVIPHRLSELCTHIAFELKYEHPKALVEACVEFYGRANQTQYLSDDLIYHLYSSDIADSLSKDKRNNVFVYSYSYRFAGNANLVNDGRINPSPAHAEDYLYLFGLHRNVFTPFDYEIEKIYSGMMANFVNTGQPTEDDQEWTKWRPETRDYFHIDFDKNLKMPGMKTGYHFEADLFWNNIARRVGGAQHPIMDFPPCIDAYRFDTVVDALVATWTNKSFAFNKGTDGCVKIANLWTNYVLGNIIRRRFD